MGLRGIARARGTIEARVLKKSSVAVAVWHTEVPSGIENPCREVLDASSQTIERRNLLTRKCENSHAGLLFLLRSRGLGTYLPVDKRKS